MNHGAMTAKAAERKSTNGPQKMEKPLCAPSQRGDPPVERILFLQRTVGNRAVQGLLKNAGSQQSAVRVMRHSSGVQSTVGERPSAVGGRRQAKLTIGPPNDIYEQEADRMADQVMRMTDATVNGQPSAISGRDGGGEFGSLKRQSLRVKPGSPFGKSPACGEKEAVQAKPLRITRVAQRQVEDEEPFQMKGTEGGNPSLRSSGEASITGVRGGGKPLSDSEREFFEPRFGADFSQVRVHIGATAEQSARDLSATAYAMGRDIVFGGGRYAPGTYEGRRLIAHELTHTLQQHESGFSMIQRDFESDFAGKQAVPATTNSPQPASTVRVQTYATQTAPARWVDAPYGIYSPNEIPNAYQDRIMESPKAFQWRNPNVPLAVALQRDLDRLENARELTVRDMRELARGAGRNMNIRIAMAKVGNDYRFVGYDMSVGGTGQPVTGGFVETEAGTTRGVGQALFADRVVRALSNRAEGMQLEVYHSQRTENFHRRIFDVVGRKGRPTVNDKYTLTTREMVRVALAWSEKLTPAQRDALRALNSRPAEPTALEAEAALWRGSVVRSTGTERVPSSQTVKGEIIARPPAPGRGGTVEPISIPEPAVRSASKKSTLAAGAISLLSMQLGSVRSAERAKAVKKLEQLGPKIDELRGQGFGVTVTLVVEVPNQVDVAAVWAGIGDVTQVVYYYDMFINQAGPPIKEQPPRPGQRQPPAYRQNYAYLVGETRDRPGEWYRHHPRPGFRFVSSDLQLLPERGLVAPRVPEARPIWVWRPDRASRPATFGAVKPLDVNRRVNMSHAGFQMWNTTTGQEYQRMDKAEGPEKTVPRNAYFVHDVPGDRHSIDSYFTYPSMKEMTEYAEFKELDGPSRADARVHWVLDQILWEKRQ